MKFHLRGMVAILFHNVFTDVAHILKYFCTELSANQLIFFLQPSRFCGVNFLDFLISIYSILFLSKLRHFCGLFPGRFVLGQRNKMRAGAVLTGTLCLSSVYVWFSCPFVRFLLILRMVGALLCQFVNSLQTCRFD